MFEIEVKEWLKLKSPDLNETNALSEDDTKSFVSYLQRQGISKAEQINEDHYYDWIGSRI